MTSGETLSDRFVTIMRGEKESSPASRIDRIQTRTGFLTRIVLDKGVKNTVFLVFPFFIIPSP